MLLDFTKAFYFISILLLFNCNTKIDLNAPEKEITVVYGLLNPSNPVQYIKVNKAFQTDKNINEAAKIKGITDYKSGDINVKLEEYDPLDTNILINTYTLTRVTNEIPKNSGVFDNTENILYKTDASIRERGFFKLIIENSINNSITTASTKTTEEINSSISISPKSFSFVDGSGGFLTTSVLISKKPINAGRIEAEFEFNYSDIVDNNSGGNDTIPHSITFKLGYIKTSAISNLKFSISGGTVMSVLEDSLSILPPNFNHRILGDGNISLYVAGSELNIYMSLDEANNGSFSKADYSNVKNGYGLFSSRTTTIWSPNRPIDYSTFTSGELTRRFRFRI